MCLLSCQDYFDRLSAFSAMSTTVEANIMENEAFFGRLWVYPLLG